MGKQAKLKEARRAARLFQKDLALYKKEVESDAVTKHLVSPPDLGVSVEEKIDMEDKFGG